MIVEKSFVLFFVDFLFDGGTLKTKESAINCAAQCIKTLGCYSYFYNMNSKSCLVSLTRYRDTRRLTHHAGYHYYMMPSRFRSKCVTTADCHYPRSNCSEETCACKVGLSYNFRKQSCVKRCTKYGRSFARYNGYGIHDYNRKKLRISTVRKCKQACVKERWFTCVNAEHSSPKRICNLSSIAWHDVPKKKREKNQKTWVLLYRNCAK